MDALLLLQILDHREQVARQEVSLRTKPAHEALARLVEDTGEFLTPDRRVDLVAQHSLAGIDITGKQVFYPFLQQGLAKHRIPLGTCLYGILKPFRQGF